MGSQLQRQQDLSLSLTEARPARKGSAVFIVDFDSSLSKFILTRAQEALGAQELGINAQEWAHVLGVTDRWVRMWRRGAEPIHKRYILSIARATQEYCKRAAARIQSLQTWAEQVVIMSAVDEYKDQDFNQERCGHGY